MIIDSHSHVVLPVERHISLMEKEGIDKTVLFPTIIHPEKTGNYADLKEELELLNKILSGETNPVSARLNSIEELYQIVTEHPEKFAGFGSCPAGMDLRQTEEWIEKYIAGNSFRGIGELSVGEGQTERLENIFKAASVYKNLPVWIHTFNPLKAPDIGNIIDMSRMYPDVNVILGHGAGSYWMEALERIQYLSNVYFDISASFTVMSIKIAAELIPERVLFSVDMPFGSPAAMKKMVEEAVTDPAVVELIFSGNIRRLLDL